MKVGIAFVSDYSDPSLLPEYARDVEERGYHSLWVPEHFMYGDVFTMLGAAAASTKTIYLGTGIACIPVRHPALTAMAASTLHKISGGRAILGIGLGDESMMRNSLGIDISNPLEVLYEATEIVKTVFKGCGDYTGKRYRFMGLSCPPLENPPKVLIAAVGFKALQLAGRLGDGVVLTAFTATKYVEAAVKTVREACAEAGRDPSRLEYAAMIATAAAGQRRELKKLAAIYLSFPRRAETVLAREQLESLDMNELRRLVRLGAYGEALRMLNDEIVEDLSATGDANSVRDKLEKLKAIGITLPILYPVGNPQSFLNPDFVKKVTDRC